MVNLKAFEAEFVRIRRCTAEALFPDETQVIPFAGHIDFMMEQIFARPYGIYVELGIDDVGPVSTAALLYAAVQVKGQVFSCDIEPCTYTTQVLEQIYNVLSDGVLWQFTQQDSGEYGEYWKSNEMGEVDVLLVDTSHRAEDTVRELAIWMPLLAHNGVACFHDTESCPEGVKKPIEDFIAVHPEFTWTNRINSFGLGVIRRKNNRD